MEPPEAFVRRTSLFVHVVKYRGEPRDYWGELVEIKPFGGKLTALVHLFAPEGQDRSWRRFVAEETEVVQ